ncbi:TetR/AcrR family transcriptional regulator [Amycolatopsis sp. BJA-103]|uniref:TetR/AcrR family transcriptional regulator n=1 Tax=unclassified Amycolatopsis TaxID=2618356 RepID=UPI000C7847A2|nr:TetR/AcrR family transcriptional regulator C-terminal domain-containing protein [Amycolatopsis sp. BJA-103]AUI58514.1 TetR family transcriptional regulator [Amycolatopsis sp. BJA-103]PNE15193.1 TetR family transcriptional regulator [Amycolatopsis sp. BJA-103]
MAQRTRAEALSRERIVEAAIALLDADGESGLTFKTLTERLSTGAGAIYWHVPNKGELLNAATTSVIAGALATEPAGSPQDEIRAIALGLFDAIVRHPWLSPQLAVQFSRSPWGSVTPRIFETLGQRVSALGVPEATWFTATSALMHYIFGAAGQNAANARVLVEVDRAEFLHAAASAWENLDSDRFPFMKSIADQVREHDDREQFLTGIDLILTGITAGA